jgi:hypothetical protein
VAGAPWPPSPWPGGAPVYGPPILIPPAAPPRRRTGLIVALIVVAAVLAIGVGSGAGWYLANHGPGNDTAAPAAAGTTTTADTATSPPALPPDQDPSKPQYAQLQLIRKIGVPVGFNATAPFWKGQDIEADSVMNCEVDGTCPQDPIQAVAAWAPDTGNTTFTLDYLNKCVKTGCGARFTRDGLTVDVSLGTQPAPYTPGLQYALVVIVDGP